MAESYDKGNVFFMHHQDPGDDFHLFRVDVKELSTLRPNVDHLMIESWREGEAPKSVKRY